jgi:rhamnose utilization protein RhaD (predicted bifunctional aldolase and dehydrogenase)
MTEYGKKFDTNELLRQITGLSRKFGTSVYVHGGGGNASVKTEDTLWVKPSGAALGTLRPNDFVALDRNKLSGLYDITFPEESLEREKMVKAVVEEAKLSPAAGRASVETPLHNSLAARFVVHTHPAVVNGMVCSKGGPKAAGTIFPQAVWLDYFEPGLTVCMEARKRIKDYEGENGSQPEIVFLKNHGVVVAADTPQQIERIYSDIFEKLTEIYLKKQIDLRLHVAPLPQPAEVQKIQQLIRGTWGPESCFVEVSGKFDYAEGPITPDYVVYTKSFPFIGEPTAEAVQEFQRQRGCKPQVFAGTKVICTVGSSPQQAALTMELARDGALVKQFSEAFGGIEYMTPEAMNMIEQMYCKA